MWQENKYIGNMPLATPPVASAQEANHAIIWPDPQQQIDRGPVIDVLTEQLRTHYTLYVQIK